MESCLFCEMISGKIPTNVLYEDENTFVFLDIAPVSKGHCLIIPKEHSKDLTHASHEAAKSIMATVHHIGPRIMKALGATGYNLGMNHGADAGQVVWHTHVHFMPRYAGDARLFEKQDVALDELTEIAETIRRQLEAYE